MKILSKETARHYQLASLNRGHVVFTSFISISGKILFLESHLERLLLGAHFLFPEMKWEQCDQELKDYVLDLFNKDTSDSYFRITLFDDCVHIERRQLHLAVEILNLTVALKMKTPGLYPAFLKVSHYLESDLEMQRALGMGFNDFLYFDHLGQLTEASTSNVFIVTEDYLVKTPSISSMVLDGVMRKKLMNNLQNNNVKIIESTIVREDLLKAREIWLTSSVRGIRFVNRFEQVNYDSVNSLYEKTLEHFGKYGELV